MAKLWIVAVRPKSSSCHEEPRESVNNYSQIYMFVVYLQMVCYWSTTLVVVGLSRFSKCWAGLTVKIAALEANGVTRRATEPPVGVSGILKWGTAIGSKSGLSDSLLPRKSRPCDMQLITTNNKNETKTEGK
jgi:hypothetical protein